MILWARLARPGGGRDGTAAMRRGFGGGVRRGFSSA